ncbi:MAG TPA: hypothetical protein PLU64_16055, partial [Saprospiraceae bacterium]|nr:hypothetical protein [Saprospiraceae bacterium]
MKINHFNTPAVKRQQVNKLVEGTKCRRLPQAKKRVPLMHQHLLELVQISSFGLKMSLFRL